MAEDKKSVLLYCDLIHTIEKMDDETAGQFFKHYLRYINDLHPKTDNLIVDVTFEAVKQSLKRDLIKWEVKKTGQSLAGIEGNLKRWHIDLYDEYKKGVYTLQDAVDIGKSREPSPPDPTRSTPIAEIAVSVSDSVTVSVSETDINNNTPPSVDGFDWINLLALINKTFGREFKKINDTVRAKYKARIKEGYTKEDITNAIKNCKNDSFHKDKNYKHCTPEYFSRSNTLDLHSAVQDTKPIDIRTNHIMEQVRKAEES
jgi:uncharacterized phage protein (TIGR02220 family)